MRNLLVLGAALVVGCSGGKSEPSCPAAAGPTIHAGEDIATDATWTAAGRPHIVTARIDIYDDATLTIEPCAEVRIAPDVGINVGSSGGGATGGNLRAIGTAARPILFTRDGATPWSSIYVHDNGRADLVHTVLYGGGSVDSSFGASLIAVGDRVALRKNLKVDNVTIRGSRGGGFGLFSLGGFTDDSRNFTVTSNGAGGLNLAAGITDPLGLGTLPSGSYTGNALDEIEINSDPDNHVIETATWRDRGVPYHLVGIPGAHVTVAPNDGQPPITLTIEPGVELHFDPDTSFIVGAGGGGVTSRAGILVARGTATNPIVFTSASATPAAGDWEGITFRSMDPDTHVIDHVRVEYAGGDCSCALGTCTASGVPHEGAISMQAERPSSAFITNTTILESGLHGIVRAWASDEAGPDFLPTNTFTNVPGCKQTMHKALDGSCPDPPPCP